MNILYALVEYGCYYICIVVIVTIHPHRHTITVPSIHCYIVELLFSLATSADNHILRRPQPFAGYVCSHPVARVGIAGEYGKEELAKPARGHSWNQ